jgi:hypothetical protein
VVLQGASKETEKAGDLWGAAISSLTLVTPGLKNEGMRKHWSITAGAFKI